jgi:hypothetical protein
MKVRIIKNYVQTGEHYGKKGQEIDVPEPVARQWVAMKAAELIKSDKKPGHD